MTRYPDDFRSCIFRGTPDAAAFRRHKRAIGNRRTVTMANIRNANKNEKKNLLPECVKNAGGSRVPIPFVKRAHENALIYVLCIRSFQGRIQKPGTDGRGEERGH